MLVSWRDGASYRAIALGYGLVGTGVGFAGTPASHSLTPCRSRAAWHREPPTCNDSGGAIMQSILGALLTAGYVAAMSAQVPSSVSQSTEATLTKSFSSAENLASQYPQYAKQITAAAKQSFVDGQDWAYVAGIIAIVAGFALVYFMFPKHDAEEALLRQYADDDQTARLASAGGAADAA